MKKLFTILLALTCASAIFAAKYDCKIDGIYYNLNNTSMTATVTNRVGGEWPKNGSYSGSIVIPSSITYKKQTYSVTTIGESAFRFCYGLTSVTIPNSVTTIEEAAFNWCTHLTSVTIPSSVTTIGKNAFSAKLGLASVTILNPNVKIADNAFVNSYIRNFYCGKSVDLSKAAGTFGKVLRLSDEELLCLLPFDQYAKSFVESQVNEWQKKGEFEKTSDWQARVNETTRKQKIDSLVRAVKKNYLAFYQKQNSPTFSLGTYDADNEVYLVQSSSKQDLLVAVPIADASYVKQNWARHTASPKYDIQGTEVVLTSADFSFPNNKTYTYKANQKLTYSTADINYNFEPIELPEMQIVSVGGGTAPAPQAQPQAAQYISSVTITTPVDLTPMSSVLVSYKNIFGKYEMPDLDVTFPYVVIRVKLTGAPNLIRLAKQSLSLDLGQAYIVEQTVPQEDKILFLVPTGVKNIYLTDGNGQRQLLYSGRLQPNTIYDGTVEVK